MKKALVLAALLLPACPPSSSPPPSPGQVLTDSAACAVDVVEDVTAAVDVAGTLKTCGLAAADLWSIVSKLFDRASAVTSDAGPGSLSLRVTRAKRLADWKSAIKTAYPDVAK